MERYPQPDPVDTGSGCAEPTADGAHGDHDCHDEHGGSVAVCSVDSGKSGSLDRALGQGPSATDPSDYQWSGT